VNPNEIRRVNLDAHRRLQSIGFGGYFVRVNSKILNFAGRYLLDLGSLISSLSNKGSLWKLMAANTRKADATNHATPICEAAAFGFCVFGTTTSSKMQTVCANGS